MVGLELGCLLACLFRVLVGVALLLLDTESSWQTLVPRTCGLKTTVVSVMSTELPTNTVSADDQLDALLEEHRLQEQNSGLLDGSTLGTASAAQHASPCIPRALAPPLPLGQTSLQLTPSAAQLIAGELSLNPLGVLAPASAPCSAPLPALPCPTVAASPNMSVFVQPSLGDLSVLSSCYPAPSTVAGSPLPLLDRVVPDQHVEPSGCGVPCTQSQLAVVHDSHGAVTPTAGTHGSVEHYSMSPEAIPVSGYHLGSVESHRLLDASELDRVKYIVEVLRSENVAIKEVLEQVVSSTKSELVSMNSRFTAAFGELRDMLGNVNHQDFSTMKHEIDRLCDHAMSVAPKFAEIDRTIQAVYMRCDGIVFDSDKRFEEQRSDYVDRLRGLSENMSGRVIELENFVQSQLAGYREQFLSIDRRFGKIEAKLASIGVAPSVHASMPSSPQQVGFPTLSQNFVQQPTNVPVPASDGQSFRSYMSHDHHGVDEHHSTSSGRTQRTLERQRPILPRETGMLRRPVEGSPVVAVGHQYVTRPVARSLQQHDSVIPRERSALKSNPLPCAYEAAPAEHVAPQLDPNTQMSSEQSQGANSNIPGMASFVENAQRHAGVSREVKHEGSCMASGNQVRPAVEVVPSRVITQTSSPAPVVVEQKAPIVVEQKGVSPSPKACVQYARTTPGWPVQPRKQPGLQKMCHFRKEYSLTTAVCRAVVPRIDGLMQCLVGPATSAVAMLLRVRPEHLLHLHPPKPCQLPFQQHLLRFVRQTILLRLERHAPHTVSIDRVNMHRAISCLRAEPQHLVMAEIRIRVAITLEMVGIMLIRPTILFPLRPLVRPEAQLEEAVVVDPARLVARLEVLLVEVEAEVIALMIMACFLPICAQPVLLLRMRSCVRDAAIIAPVHPHETACLVSTDVVRFVALIQCVSAKYALSGLQEIPSLEGQDQIAGRRKARTSGRTTKRPSARVSRLRRNLLPISSVLG